MNETYKRKQKDLYLSISLLVLQTYVHLQQKMMCVTDDVGRHQRVYATQMQSCLSWDCFNQTQFTAELTEDMCWTQTCTDEDNTRTIHFYAEILLYSLFCLFLKFVFIYPFHLYFTL